MNIFKVVACYIAISFMSDSAFCLGYIDILGMDDDIVETISDWGKKGKHNAVFIR